MGPRNSAHVKWSISAAIDIGQRQPYVVALPSRTEVHSWEDKND